MKYLTDAERQLRPARIRSEYPYWIAFRLPVSGDREFRRYFRSAEARDRYGADLPENATIIEKGDDS